MPAPGAAANELPQKASWVAEIAKKILKAKYTINNYFLSLILFWYHTLTVLSKHPLSFNLI